MNKVFFVIFSAAENCVVAFSVMCNMEKEIYVECTISLLAVAIKTSQVVPMPTHGGWLDSVAKGVSFKHH